MAGGIHIDYSPLVSLLSASELTGSPSPLGDAGDVWRVQTGATRLTSEYSNKIIHMVLKSMTARR